MTAPHSTGEPPQKAHSGWLPYALDFGPLLVFFGVFKYVNAQDKVLPGVQATVYGTAAFMVAIIIAIVVAKWKLGRVSPMMWLSAVLVIGFGALTIYFHDERFIQIKPTIIYTGFAALLLGGWMRGKALLKYLFGNVYEGLSEQGWLLFSRNWGVFFAVLAAANEVMRRMLSFESWLTIKVWGITAASFLFLFANVPMLMRHGFALDDGKGDSPPDDTTPAA